MGVALFVNYQVRWCLFAEVNGTFEDGIEGSSLQHSILQKGEVDELVNAIITLGIVWKNAILLIYMQSDLYSIQMYHMSQIH